MCQTVCEKQPWLGNTAWLFFFFYNYDFISFPNCAGNVKYLRCHSSIIVGSLFMCLLYSAPRVHCVTYLLLHDKVALEEREARKKEKFVFCSEVPGILFMGCRPVLSILPFPPLHLLRKNVSLPGRANTLVGKDSASNKNST